MFITQDHLRVWLYAKPTDMRKSFQGLSALVTTQLHQDPMSGHLYVFINRKKTYIKVLYYDRGGYCVWAKKLTQGQFNHGERCTSRSIDVAELMLLIEGIDTTSVRRYKRFRRANDG